MKCIAPHFFFVLLQPIVLYYTPDQTLRSFRASESVNWLFLCRLEPWPTYFEARKLLNVWSCSWSACERRIERKKKLDKKLDGLKSRLDQAWTGFSAKLSMVWFFWLFFILTARTRAVFTGLSWLTNPATKKNEKVFLALYAHLLFRKKSRKTYET